jgi:hypothetical protein
MPRKVTPKGKAATPPTADTPKPAKKTTTRKRTTKAAEPQSENKYIRNIRGVQCRITLDDDRILLEPRGQRGDIKRVVEDHMADPNFEPNIGMIYEVLNEEAAKDILRKQANNQQVGATTVDYLLNEYGQPYQRGPVVERPYEQQGQVVAQIQDGGQTRHSDRSEQIVRGQGAPPLPAQVPGSVGYPQVQVPSNIPADQVADWVARNTPAGENSNAGDIMRGSLRVSIDPTQPGL